MLFSQVTRNRWPELVVHPQRGQVTTHEDYYYLLEARPDLRGQEVIITLPDGTRVFKGILG